MKTPSLFLRILSFYFAVWLTVPGAVLAQLTITGPTFPATNTLRVGLTGAESTNAHVIFWTPTFVSDINTWTRLTTGTVGQTAFDFSTTTNRQSYFRAGIAPVSTPTVATPVFAPGGGSYGSPTNVTITCATMGAAIYFTTNGSTPTTLDNYIYDGASVLLSSVTTLKGKAFLSGYFDSAVASATYTINSPPTVNAGAQQILASSSTTLKGVVIDDGLTGAGTRFTNWSKITGPGTVTFGNTNQTNSSASFSANGIYTLKLAASDGQYTNSAQVTIAVNPTLSVSLVEPDPLSTVSVPTNILLRAEASCTSGSVTQVVFYANGAAIGTATNSEFSFYWRSVPLGTNNLMAVAFSSDVANASLSSTNPVSLIVNWPTDIGRVTLAETDISIPTAGLPLALNRLYDSKRGTNGSFGANGRMDIEDISIRKSDLLSSGYLAVTQLGQDYIRVNHSTVVTVSLGGGEEYQFAPHLVFQSGGLDHVGHTTVNYTLPVRWVFDSLTGRGALASVDSTSDAGMLNNNTVNGTWSGAVDVAVCDDPLCSSWTAEEPDFSAFTFTAPDGTRYTFNSAGGLYQKIDRNGNTLTYNSADITWSNPNVGSSKQLGLTRDGNNRITEVYDPVAPSPTGPPALKYAYDALGNLTNVARLIQRTTPIYENTGYAYTNASYPNAITAITDPRGVTSQRYEYDGSGRLTKQTDALNRFTSHTYDTANRRQTMIDRLSHTTVQTFTPAGQLASVSDAGGAVTSYLYDGEGRRTAEINPLGLTNTFAYDSQDNLLASTNEVGAATSATYNEFGQVLTTTDARNAGTTNEYDANGNLISVTNAIGVVSGFGYNALGECTAETNAFGLPEQMIVLNDYNEFGWLTNNSTALNAASHTYDDNGNRLTELRVRTLPGGGTENVLKQWNYDAANRVTLTIDPLNGTNRTSHNGLGKQSLTIDALNRTNRFDYDAVGLLTNTVFADGLNESSTYDAEGRRLTSVDRANRTTSYTYDALGRLLRTTFADTSYAENGYDAAGRLQTSTQAPVTGGFGPPADGLITGYDYDAAGRRTTVINALNQTNSFAYDANGNQTNIVDALGRTNRYEFDALNRQTKMIFPDNTSEATGYDALDRKVSVTNQASIVTRFGYDALGRLVAVTNAFGTGEQLVTRYDYDELGNLLRQIDGLNRTNKFEYDALGRRTKETLPQTQSQTFGYDAVGNMKFQTNFTGTIITNQFDALNRLTNKASAGGYKVTFAYSATGTRTNMTDASGTNSYAYDNRDRLLMNSWAIIATNQTMTLAYSYNSFGNLASVTSSSTNGTLVNYTYDVLNRLTNVMDRFAQGATYTFDAVGNLDTARSVNLVTNRWQYNSLNRLTNVSVTTAGGSIANFAYRLAAAGNRTNLLESVNGSARTNAWTYDALYRLTNEALSGAAPGGSVSYKYDVVGNRTNRTSTLAGVTNQTFAYTGNDWLTGDSYDGNGNTTNATGNSYRYDAENRLTNFNAGAATFIYDGDGNRKIKTAGGGTTYFLVDALSPNGHAQVMEELDSPNATPVRLYTHGLDLVCQRQGGTTSYYGYDGNGNTRFLTTTNAAITDTYAYDSFGILVTNTGTTTNFYRYSGEQYDPTLGLTYLRARYVNTGTGRFINRDSFEGNADEPMSLHRYLYAHDDPVNNIDPSGNEIEAVLTAISISGGLAANNAAPTAKAKDAAKALTKLKFSPKNKDAGIVERLLLAESKTPFSPGGFNKSEVFQGMSAIGACIVNRVKTKGFPKTITGVITDKKNGVQFHGFDTYPEYDANIVDKLEDVLKWTNTKNAKQAEFRELFQKALDVAKQVADKKVTDPYGSNGGTYFFRTADSSPPGPATTMPLLGTLGGNTFYSLKSPVPKE